MDPLRQGVNCDADGHLEGLSVGMLVFNSLRPDIRVWKEASALAAEGATVDVFGLRRPGQPLEENPFDGVTVHRITSHVPSFRQPSELLRAGLTFARSTQAFRRDVWHAHDGATLPWAARAARRHNARLIYDAHEFFPGFTPDRRTALRSWVAENMSLDRRGEARYIRQADAVVTVNESIAALLTYVHSLDVVPTVLRNSASYWSPSDTQRDVLRQRIGVSTSTPVLLFQGATNPSRGVENCIAALSEVPSAHFVALGPISDQHRGSLQLLASDLGVSDRVHLLGPVPYDELLSYTTWATAGIYLPRHEAMSVSYRFSLPNKVFEFVMARVPSIMTGLPEIRRILEEFDCGVTVADGRPSTVAAAVHRVLDRPRTEWRRALDTAAKQLSWEMESRRLIDLYMHLR